jgi:hypothetical protein
MPSVVSGKLSLPGGGYRLLESGGYRLLEGGTTVSTGASIIYALFDTTCVVRRLAATADAGRAPVAAWPALIEDVACRVDDLSGGQAFTLMQRGISGTKDVLMDYPGQDILNGDAIEVDGCFLRVTHVDVRRELYSGEVSLGIICEDYTP